MLELSTFPIFNIMTFRIEFNLTTKIRKEIPWTPEEWSIFQEQTNVETKQQIIIQSEKEHQIKINGSMAGGGTTTHTKIEAPRDKKGRVDWSALGQKLKDQGRFNIA